MEDRKLEDRLKGLEEEFQEYRLAQIARINGLRHAVATALVAVTGQGGKVDDIIEKLQNLEDALLPDTHQDTGNEIAALR